MASKAKKQTVGTKRATTGASSKASPAAGRVPAAATAAGTPGGAREKAASKAPAGALVAARPATRVPVSATPDDPASALVVGRSITRTTTATAGGTVRVTRSATVVATVAATVATTGDVSEDDLIRLRDATKLVFEALRDGEADVPVARSEEYWRDRHMARTAWESAENAAFENLVAQQRQQLPSVSASNVKLAHDVQTTANVLAALDLVSASLGIVASVISLLA